MASKIILLIYGPGYIQSIIALQILIWTIVFMFLNNLSSNLLGSVNRPVVVAKIVAIAAVVNIILKPMRCMVYTELLAPSILNSRVVTFIRISAVSPQALIAVGQTMLLLVLDLVSAVKVLMLKQR